jgi:hypothetical protein
MTDNSQQPDKHDFDNDENSIVADLRVWVYSLQKMDEKEIVAAIINAIHNLNEFLSTVISPNYPSTQPSSDAKAMEFARWTNDNYYNYLGDDRWFQDVPGKKGDIRYTTEQLYSIFNKDYKGDGATSPEAARLHGSMRWVKASERLPEKERPAKMNDQYGTLSRNHGFIQFCGRGFSNSFTFGSRNLEAIEWLDESHQDDYWKELAEACERVYIWQLKSPDSEEFHRAFDHWLQLKNKSNG